MKTSRLKNMQWLLESKSFSRDFFPHRIQAYCIRQPMFDFIKPCFHEQPLIKIKANFELINAISEALEYAKLKYTWQILFFFPNNSEFRILLLVITIFCQVICGWPITGLESVDKTSDGQKKMESGLANNFFTLYGF